MLEGLQIKLRKLPWKLQRTFGNLGYSLHIFRGPASRRKPSTSVLAILVIGIVGFILAGGIYDLTNSPISSAFNQYWILGFDQGNVGAADSERKPDRTFSLHARSGRIVHAAPQYEICL